MNIEKVKAMGKGGPVSWLCPGGLKEMGIALKKANAGEARITTVEEPGKPKTLYVDTSDIAPEYLTDEEFLVRRRLVLEEFKNHYSQPKPNPAVHTDAAR